MGARVIVIALLLCSALPQVTSRADHAEYYSYGDLQTIVDEWESMGATIYVPATSEGGRSVFLVEVGDGPFTILFSNVLHANEPSGSEAFIRFVYALLGQLGPTFEKGVLPGVTASSPVIAALSDPAVRAELLSRVKIVGFPMMDPDGFENAHTRDFFANSDYLTKVTEQSAALDWALEEFEPDLYIDSHGGPDKPELNIGLVEPAWAPSGVLAQSRRAAEVAWRAASAVGAGVTYFEEHLFEILLGEHSEPFASADEAYWSLASRGLPVTQESYQLEGLPAVYTETVGLQSVDPIISISEGASVQQVTMIGVALEAAGLLGDQVPRKAVSEPAAMRAVEMPVGAQEFSWMVRWKLPGQDYTLTLLDDQGGVVETQAWSGDPFEPGSRSRAIGPRSLPPGRYTLAAVPRLPGVDDDSTGRAIWREPDPETWTLGAVLDPDADVEFCLGGSALGDALRLSPLTSRFATPRCD